MDNSRKKELKKMMKMIKSVKETQSHDRESCICEGCHNYALMTSIFQNGRLYKVVPDWKSILPEEYFRSLQQIMQYKMDKMPKDLAPIIKKLEEKGVPKNDAKTIVEQMFQPMHVVFYKPPQHGLVKEI